MLEVPESSEFDHPGSNVYLTVADLDSAVTTLESRGVVFRDEPHHVGDLGDVAVWMAFFDDSEGNLLALQVERTIENA